MIVPSRPGARCEGRTVAERDTPDECFTQDATLPVMYLTPNSSSSDPHGHI